MATQKYDPKTGTYYVVGQDEPKKQPVSPCKAKIEAKKVVAETLVEPVAEVIETPISEV